MVSLLFLTSLELLTDWSVANRYSTGSDLNTYSALIQNFYSQETAPHQAIHIAVNTGTQQGGKPAVQAYIRWASGRLYTKMTPLLILLQLTRRRTTKTGELRFRADTLRTPLFPSRAQWMCVIAVSLIHCNV